MESYNKQLLNYLNQYLECADAIVKRRGEEIFLLYLKGSQNYGLDNEDSDIDLIVVTIPTLQGVLCNKVPCSSTYKMTEEPFSGVVENSKGLLTFMDIRNYFLSLKKNNPTTLESLFTSYYVVNPKYKNFFFELQKLRNDIVLANPKKLILSLLGGANSEYGKVTNEFSKENLDYYKINKAKASFFRFSLMARFYLKTYQEEDFDYNDILTFKSNKCWQRLLYSLKNTRDRLYSKSYDDKMKKMLSANLQYQKEWKGWQENEDVVTYKLLDNLLCDLFRFSII